MRDTGALFWKKRWFHFCSEHQEYEDTCTRCTHGSWRNVWKNKIDQVLYKISPKLWLGWINLWSR